ncbi:Sterol O-acyltransferase 1 [Toxocara canis]|uniref:O-acyltransferase n=1 Tax=Toxocara canis TaxID=6265 RepID=A0A0B2UP84_TOXCA|nr:Sterol O-acyltransferase 1 [Toxocara canis]
MDDEEQKAFEGENEKKKRETTVSSTAHHQRKLTFRDKRFETRPSLLTVLMESADMRALRSFIISCFILMFLGTLLDDTITSKNPFNHLWLVLWNFRQLPETLFVWSQMALSALLPYYALKLWSEMPCKRVTLRSGLPLIALYIAYLFSLFTFPLIFLFKWQLNCACSFIITCENTRIAMKMHSFVRENVMRAIRMKLAAKDDTTKHQIPETFPSVKQLVYFFFCPSFIYRDDYPRSPSRDWNIVLKYFIEVLLTILCTNLVFIQMIYPRFNHVDYTKANISFMVNAIFASILPGLLCLLLLFYGLLHCWLNMFSEMLRFGDRKFYVDWWNSKNMAEYYRNWNLVVHDWLYAYVYRDIALLIGGKKGLKVSQTAVFFLSAAFHEYWFGTSLRFFYPVMFVLYFIFGGIFYWVSMFIKSAQAWNVIMYANLLIGTGMFVSFYSQEWYARQRCLPTSTNSYVDFFLPRHWFCVRYSEDASF